MLALPTRLCHGSPMATRNPIAGGFFLTTAILVGFAVGVGIGQPTIGLFAGTAVGIVIAILLWLVDRRRR
jgi:hypothetical protein